MARKKKAAKKPAKKKAAKKTPVRTKWSGRRAAKAAKMNKRKPLKKLKRLNEKHIDHIKQAAAIVTVVRSEARRKIISFLRENGKTSVGEIAKSLKEGQSQISQNLIVMKKAQLLTSTRDGQYIFYEINKPAVKNLFNLIAALADL